MKICVLLEIETDDKRLTAPENSTAGATAMLRRAVIDNLPKMSRVIAVMPEPVARHMMLLHEAIGEELLGREVASRPPAGYVPPTRD